MSKSFKGDTSSKQTDVNADIQAIVEIKGGQYKVTPSSFIYVPRMKGDIGDLVTLQKICLLKKGDKIDIGKPYVANCSVKTTILAHVLADKKIVFKKKRRKGYQVCNGHRQKYTKLNILSIQG